MSVGDSHEGGADTLDLKIGPASTIARLRRAHERIPAVWPLPLVRRSAPLGWLKSRGGLRHDRPPCAAHAAVMYTHFLLLIVVLVIPCSL
jgi:hypothetical protein